MCKENCPFYLEPDECDAYKEIEQQIGHCEPEQARAMYDVSQGRVCEYIVIAAMEHIASGNQALLAEFPELAPAAQGDPGAGLRGFRKLLRRGHQP